MMNETMFQPEGDIECTCDLRWRSSGESQCAMTCGPFGKFLKSLRPGLNQVCL